MIRNLLPMNQNSSKYKLQKFIEATHELNDWRDERGKRHRLPFVLCGVLLAILSGRARVSSIQRYMANRIVWLREVTGEREAGVVSRAQLPRILSRLDRPALNAITMKHFGIHLLETSEGEWKAIDGKTLCGTPDESGSQRTRIVTAVDHESRETEFQCELNSTKKGEITVVRTFLQETGLEKANVTLDALHLNPITTAQIEQAGGHYIIQAKRNQPDLCDTLNTVAHTTAPLAILNTIEPGHGRQEERWAWFFDLSAVCVRWPSSCAKPPSPPKQPLLQKSRLSFPFISLIIPSPQRIQSNHSHFSRPFAAIGGRVCQLDSQCHFSRRPRQYQRYPARSTLGFPSHFCHPSLATGSPSQFPSRP